MGPEGGTEVDNSCWYRLSAETTCLLTGELVGRSGGKEGVWMTYLKVFCFSLTSLLSSASLLSASESYSAIISPANMPPSYTDHTKKRASQTPRQAVKWCVRLLTSTVSGLS